jgi:alpha-L-rhamnosidase
MNPDLIWRKGRGDDFGDWLNSDTFVLPPNVCLPKVNGAVPKEVFATAFFAHSTELVGRMAAILGHRDDAALYTQQAADIKTAFVRTFVQADGTVAGDTQAGYALALHFGLLPTALEAAAARRMVENIASYDNHLTTGIQATIRLMLELSRHGHHDVACQLVNQRTMPSWGYTIDQGATTIWERWDGYVPGRGWYLSLNHYALGAVGEWVWRHLVGINPDDQHPGYQHILIRPRPGAGLTWVKGEYNSIRGPIAVAWKVAEGGFSLDVTIPANTTATVFVPDTSADKVSESGQPLAQTKGVRFLRLENGAVVVAVDSGQYSFLAR